MSKRYAFWTISLAVLVFAGVLYFYRGEISGAVPQARTVAAAPGAPQPAAPGAEAPASAAPGSAPQPAAADAAGAAAESNYDPEQDNGEIAFRADAGGRLVLNEKTRLDLERLYALFIPKDREKKLKEVVATLPPEAGNKLFELVAQYQNYQAAAYQAYPPDREITTVEQGVAQIDGMHGLRVQHFGAEATEKMFGNEEKAQRQLYKLMENEKDQGLTVEQKAERAQQLYLEQQGR